MIVTYPVTIAVFYLIGSRRRSGSITGGNLLVIYGCALLGEILGQTIGTFLSSTNISFGLPLSYTTAPVNSLDFLFIALGGFALSNLSRPSAGSSSPGSGPLVVTLVALAFAAVGSFSLAGITLSADSMPAFQMSLVILSLPVQLVVFYYLGRRYPVSGRTLRYFGQLFVGIYIGSIVGAVAAVALLGQGSWTLPPGQGSLSFSNGVVYQNVAPSWRALLESLNPIGSLPIVSFFAMVLSRTSPGEQSPVSAGPKEVTLTPDQIRQAASEESRPDPERTSWPGSGAVRLCFSRIEPYPDRPFI